MAIAQAGGCSALNNGVTVAFCPIYGAGNRDSWRAMTPGALQKTA